MSRKKEKQLKLSYESDGIMGQENKISEEQILKHRQVSEEFFFNTTQNSE